MGFLKPSSGPVSTKVVAWLQSLIWVLIYGGLLTLILGLFVERVDDDMGWTMVAGGWIVASVGGLLIYVRSRIGLES